MYDRARFIKDFPWTRIPRRSFGPHRWSYPGDGWFSFIPLEWVSPVYTCLSQVDAFLKEAHIDSYFYIHRIEYGDGALHVWYGYEREVIDAMDKDIESLLQGIDTCFFQLAYVTSLIELSSDEHDVLRQCYEIPSASSC